MYLAHQPVVLMLYADTLFDRLHARSNVFNLQEILQRFKCLRLLLVRFNLSLELSFKALVLLALFL